MREGWREYPLKEITSKIGSGATPKGGNAAYKDEGISLIRSLNVHDLEFRTRNLAHIDETQAAKLSNVEIIEGDVLLNITGASIARCCTAPPYCIPARVNQHVSIIRPLTQIVDSKYLSLLLTSKKYKDALLTQGEAGSTRQALTKSQLQNFRISIPPLPEQKRIVAILDEAFAGISQAIANTERNLKNARELFDGYLDDVFTRKGEGWFVTTISDLVEKRILAKPLDGNHGDVHPKKADFVQDGVPFIMASDLIDGDVDQIHCNHISRKQADALRKGFARDGDVLLTHKGTIGRSAVLSTQHDYVMLTPQVTYFRVIDSNIMSNRFLYFCFKSNIFQDEICEIAGKGSTRAYVGITRQLDLHVSYPPLDEQLLLVAAFDSLFSAAQRLEAIYQQKLTALAELKQSILQKAFTGQLTDSLPL